MAEKNWAAILKGEDRIIANSDRRFRYHCYSLESILTDNGPNPVSPPDAAAAQPCPLLVDPHDDNKIVALFRVA